MATYKTPVIERLFDLRWDSNTKTLTTPFVTLEEVVEEIRAYNTGNPLKQISTKNPANFFKDLVRSIQYANKVWPKSVFDRGYTGAQQTSAGRCFVFLPLPPNAAEAFIPILPPDGLEVFPVSTLQIPTLARALSRRDETWLMQVATRLQLIELHLSVHSPHDLIYVELLQIGVKQNLAEIDALYMGHTKNGDDVIITVEAKTKDDIYQGQIVSQVLAVRSMKSLVGADVSSVIPLAIKSLPGRGIYIVEFESVKPHDPDPKELKVVAESMIQLKPPLKKL